MNSLDICGKCPFFLYEDANGNGVCDITSRGCHLDYLCAVQSLNVRQTIKVLHVTQKWRRGCKIKMPIPRIIGLAIDKAIHELRKLPEDDWAYSLKSDTFTTKTK